MKTETTVKVPVSVLQDAIAWMDDAKLAQTNPERQKAIYRVQSQITAAIKAV